MKRDRHTMAFQDTFASTLGGARPDNAAEDARIARRQTDDKPLASMMKPRRDITMI